MGDRAHVYIHEGDRPGVYVYTHWHGTSLPEMVRQALATDAAQGRRTDIHYLTRIMIDSLTEGQDPALGWGVGAEPGDTSDRGRVVDVDVDKQTVTMRGDQFTRDPVPLIQARTDENWIW